MRPSFRTLLTVLILAAALAAAWFILTYEPGRPAAPAAAADPTGAAAEGPPSVRLVSWNIQNLGGSKSDAEIAFMAEQLRGADLVAVQEVITSPPGAQAVARLADALGRTGFAWDYRLSEPTTGDGSERYAFLWKPSRVQLQGRPWLEATLADPIDREPYLARFVSRATGRPMLVASFHAVPRGKDPEKENALLDQLHQRYPDDHLVVVGDFNQDGDHAAFDGLKASGYRPVLVDQKTSLKMMRSREGEHLANEYDNIFYETGPLHLFDGGVLDYTPAFPTLKDARTISDHLPVYAELGWR